jgi:hypothetical protein
MTNSVPDRANSRRIIRVGERVPLRRSGVVSSAEIEAAVKASGIPDDSETSGPTGLRKKPISEGKKDPKTKHLYGE